MWHIAFPCDSDCEAGLNKVLPVGYRAEQETEHAYLVKTEDFNKEVGRCRFAGGVATMSFDNEKPEGHAFAQAWGMTHPDMNPLTPLQGIVYLTEDGLYQLDKLPIGLLPDGEKLHYVSAGRAFFVEFLKGDWTDEYLTVLTMRRIWFTGDLDTDTGPATLRLGNIENEKTM